MKRRDFIGLNGAAIAATGLTAGGLQDTAWPQEPAVDPSAVGNPSLFNPDPTKVSVVWRVHQNSAGAVEYGTTEKLGQTATMFRHGLCQRDDTVLMVHLENLEPDTTYYYRTVTMPMEFFSVGRNKHSPSRKPDQRGNIYKFRTLSTKADTASFAMINDTHENTPVIHGLFEQIQAEPVDTVIWNGDLFNNVHTKEIVTEQTIDLLGPKEYATSTPIVFVYGNHDIRAEHAPDLENIFPTRQGQRYFTWQNGPIQFMVLDTGEVNDVRDVTSFPDYRSEQIPWITKQIKRPEWKAAPFRVAICHIPLHGPWCSHDARNKWHDLMVEGKVDLMLHGHTHAARYSPPAPNRPYSMMVGGGPKPHEAVVIRGRVDGRELKLSSVRFNGKPAGGNFTIPARS